MSFFFLNRKPTSKSLAGAFLILLGCILSGLRNVFNVNSKHHKGDDVGVPAIYWYSTVFFVVGQFFLGIERVYEDYIFTRYSMLHPMKMFCWTMYVQFFLYILFLPTQMLSIFGGIQPSKLSSLLPAKSSGSDGLLQRFQLLVYPEQKKSWNKIDRKPNTEAFKRLINVFKESANLSKRFAAIGSGVRFSALVQNLK